MNNELYHYGVPGMKWGVRKRIEDGGVRTQRGAEAFNKKLKQYESADQRVKEARKNGRNDEYRFAKKERKLLKRSLNKSYKQLKRDYLADKGQKLHEQGLTRRGNLAKAFGAQMAVGVGGGVASGLIQAAFGNTPISRISSATIGVGAEIAGTIIGVKAAQNSRALRTYQSYAKKETKQP